ncbi:hypothetical protein MBLNU13_g00977t1 [Cladosporium sp. NU13]
MSCNNNSPVSEKPNASNESATLWEHFVLRKASEKKLMLFDLDIENKRFKANKTPKKKRTMSTAALDAATTLAMNERQRANSAPAPFGNPTTSATASCETNGNPPRAYRFTLDPIHSFSTQTTYNSTSFATSFDSVTLDSDHNITFGPNDLLSLSPATFRDDAERQAALIKVRPTEGMTMKRRMLAEEGLPAEDEQLMMSGGLDAGDVRCEVCPAKKRAMDGSVEAGIVAL